MSWRRKDYEAGANNVRIKGRIGGGTRSVDTGHRNLPVSIRVYRQDKESCDGAEGRYETGVGELRVRAETLSAKSSATRVSSAVQINSTAEDTGSTDEYRNVAATAATRFLASLGEPDTSKYTLTLRKGADGKWLIMPDMDNSSRR